MRYFNAFNEMNFFAQVAGSKRGYVQLFSISGQIVMKLMLAIKEDMMMSNSGRLGKLALVFFHKLRRVFISFLIESTSINFMQC